MSNKANSLSSEEVTSSIKDEYSGDNSSTRKDMAKQLNPTSDTDFDDGINEFKMHEVDWENLEIKLKEAQIEIDNQVCFN